METQQIILLAVLVGSLMHAGCVKIDNRGALLGEHRKVFVGSYSDFSLQSYPRYPLYMMQLYRDFSGKMATTPASVDNPTLHQSDFVLNLIAQGKTCTIIRISLNLPKLFLYAKCRLLNDATMSFGQVVPWYSLYLLVLCKWKMK